ncbi:MAG: copper amine oxidase N-terminal domain-containing protein [Armatimonadota bacterium]
MRYRLALLCYVLSTLTVLAWAAEGPKGLMVGDMVVVPARTVAQWLGVACSLEKQTLTVGNTVLVTTVNRRAATLDGKSITMPAPCIVLNGIAYLPARTLAEAFWLEAAYETKAQTLTLTHAGARPLVLPVVPFPRPADMADDTLAGLTPGDHLALAVARWGDPIAEDESAMPGARAYQFNIDPAGGVELLVWAKGDEITLIHTSLTGSVLPGKLDAATLRATGTAGGAQLAQAHMPKAYGPARSDYSHYSEDVVIANYRRGRVVVITLHTFIGGNQVTTTELTLVRAGFKKDWLPMSGPA